MTDNKKNFTSKLNTIYFIILGCLLGSLLIFNSDYVNNQKASAKIYEEKAKLFNRIISTRKLQAGAITDGSDEYIYETDEVCSHASDDLQEYYKTGDLSKIKLNNDGFESEDKDTEYMKALIDLFKSFAGDTSSTTSTPPTGPSSPPGDGRRNLRNLLSDDDMENIKKYGMSRILASLIFLIISPLCIIGWIVCWFCCCCNCCCCCCCTKPGCKTPCFIFSYVFYALVVGCSIYGLTQASKIFVGLADTECSLLQFFDQIIYGEKKDDGSPKWIGIEGVSNLLDDLERQINDMQNSNLMEQLNYYKGSIQEEKDDFENSLDDAKKFFYDDINNYIPKDKYSENYAIDDNHPVSGGKFLRGRYILGVIDDFINKDGIDGISSWKQEINGVDGTAQGVLNDASSNFNTLIDKLDDINQAVIKGKNLLSNLRRPFDNVYNDVSEILYDISDYSDKNGKITVNLVFGVLAFINICLAVLMLFILMFSGKSCVNCSFCRCIFKFATHILWNILAILMILSFLVGSILTLVGRVGGDLMSFVSFIVSAENFQGQQVLLNKLGGGKDILKRCLIENGDLAELFGLQELSGHFDSVASSRTSIDNSIADFRRIITNYPTYINLYESLRKKTEFTDDTLIKHTGTDGVAPDTADSANLKDIINLLNAKVPSEFHEKWDLNEGDPSFECSDGSDQTIVPLKLHPWTCEPKHRTWAANSNDIEVKSYRDISSDIIELLKKANGTIETGEDNSNYYTVLNDLKYEYTNYLDQYLGVLGFFGEVVDDIMGILRRGIGNSGSAFSFLNGKFIDNNLKIILKYLKYSLGKDFYSVGLCLVIVGFSLMLSISSTILLIVVINKDLENNKKLAQNTEIPNYPLSNDGRVIGFKYD
jgi:hypothetical protein